MLPNNFTRPIWKTVLLIMLYFFTASVAKSQVVRLDSSFGNNGLFTIHPDSIFSSATILKVLPAKGGNSYVFYQVGFNQFNIAKYLKTGALDTSFGNKGYTQSEILTFTDALIQPDGKIVAAGRAQLSSPYDDIKILRYNTNGIRDSAFGNNGQYTYSADFTSLDAVNGLTIQGDNIVFSTHSISNVLGINSFGIQVLNTNGTLSKIFGTGNPVPISHQTGSNNLIVSQGVKFIVYLSGIFGTTDGFYRYNANGSLDSTFGLNGILVVSIIPKTLLIDQNNKLLVGGSTDGGLTFTALVRYNINGAPDSSFNGTGKQTISVSKIALQQDKLLVAGYNTISRLNNDGSFDVSFGINGIQSTGKLYNLDELLVDSNKFYIAGYFQLDSNSNVFRAIAAYILGNPISLACPPGKVVTTDKEKGSVIVNGIDPVLMPVSDFSIIKYKLSGATIGTGTGTASGKAFNTGITTVWYSLIADSTKTCSFTVTVKEREDQEGKLRVSVYPNPTKNYFNILTETSNNKELITIRILDIYGRIKEIKSKVAPNSIVQLGGNYHAGVYFAECIQDNQKVIVILIKL